MPPWRTIRSLAMVLLLVWGGSQAVSWWQAQRFAEAVHAGSQRHALVVYTTDTCPYCARARAWLNANGATWRECNVEHDATCRRTYEAQGAPGVPMVQVGRLWDLGFNPAWVASAMATLDTESAQSPSGASSPRP